MKMIEVRGALSICKCARELQTDLWMEIASYNCFNGNLSRSRDRAAIHIGDICVRSLADQIHRDLRNLLWDI